MFELNIAAIIFSRMGRIGKNPGKSSGASSHDVATFALADEWQLAEYHSRRLAWDSWPDVTLPWLLSRTQSTTPIHSPGMYLVLGMRLSI